jgi:hypothetical protein
MEGNKMFGKNIYPCFQLSQRMLLSIQGISTFFFIKGLKIPAYEPFTILKNSAGADGHWCPRSRVCTRTTLRSAPNKSKQGLHQDSEAAKVLGP